MSERGTPLPPLRRAASAPTEPTRPRRTQQERRSQTRALLLDATIALLDEAGYAATTTRRVAELAGVSQGAMTHHFPHRADLVAAAVERLYERRAAVLKREVSALPAEPAENARELLELLWRDFSSSLFTVFVKLWVAAADDPELYERMIPVERSISRMIATESVAFVEAFGRRPDSEARMQVVLATLRGLALSRAFEPGAGRGRDQWPAIRRVLEEIIVRPD
jgi:AcrR family transcriptional regulator